MSSNKNINVTYDFPPLDSLNPTKDWKRFTRDLIAFYADPANGYRAPQPNGNAQTDLRSLPKFHNGTRAPFLDKPGK